MAFPGIISRLHPVSSSAELQRQLHQGEQYRAEAFWLPALMSSQRVGAEGTAEVCMLFSRLIYGCCCVAEITFIPLFETGGCGQSMWRLTESSENGSDIKQKLNILFSFRRCRDGKQPLLEQALWQGAAALSQDLPPFEDHQGRDAANGVAAGDGGLLFGV